VGSVGYKRVRRSACRVPGAGLLLSFLLVYVAGGCRGASERPPDPEVEGARALGLEGGARLHRVILGGRGAEEHVLPARVRAVPGDGIEFVTVDHRVHNLSFPADSISREARDFLTSTAQESIPPLLHRGNRFILRLVGAPLGRFPFLSEGHGGTAYGVIEVVSPTDSLATGPS